MTATLHVLLNGEHVATLHDARYLAALEYTPHAIRKYGAGTPLLSISLPVSPEPYPGTETRSFLDGLLPEEHVRAALANRARVATEDTFGLLRAYGLDCAGAVQVVDPDAGDDRAPTVRWLSDDELAEVIGDLPTAPLGSGVSAGVRASLGGLQGKLPVVVEGDRIGVGENGYPSTHILKPAALRDTGHERWPGIVQAEAFGQRTVERLHRAVPRSRGRGAAEVRPIVVNGRHALLVTRFDRTGTTRPRRRRHQEDLAQAMGIAEKYQRNDYEPPRLSDIAGVLEQHAALPLEARTTLLRLVVTSAVLGNCDLHARNFTVMLDPGKIMLSPAYDVVPTTAWPDMDRELALRIGGEILIDDLGADHFVTEGRSWGMRPRAVTRALIQTLDALEPALDATVDEAERQGWAHPTVRTAYEQAVDRTRVFRAGLG